MKDFNLSSFICVYLIIHMIYSSSLYMISFNAKSISSASSFIIFTLNFLGCVLESHPGIAIGNSSHLFVKVSAFSKTIAYGIAS